MASGVYGNGIFPDLEVKLRAADRPCLANRPNSLALGDPRAGLHPEDRCVCVGGHPAARMADENEVPEPAQLVARVHHFPRCGRSDRCAFGNGDVDTVIVEPARFGPEARDDRAAHRPSERGWRPGGGGRGQPGRR